MEYRLLVLLVCIPNSLQDFYKSNDQPLNLSLPCEEGTSHPIAKNCRKYYKCVNGKLKLRTCPGIDEFSPVYKWCLPPNLARCWHAPKPRPMPATCIIPPLTTSKPPVPANATTTKPSTISKSTTFVTSSFKVSTTAVTSLDNATEVSEKPSSGKVTHEILTSPSTDELLSTRSLISITPNKQSTYEKSTATVVISSTVSSLTNTTPYEPSSKTVPPPTQTLKTKTPDQWHTTLLPSSPGELPSQKDIETTTANEVTTVQLSTKNKKKYSTPVSTSSDKQFTDITESTKSSSGEFSTFVSSTSSVSNNTIPSKTTKSTSTIKDSTKAIVPSESTPSSPGITEVSTRVSSTEASKLPTGLSSTQQPYFVTTEEVSTILSRSPTPNEPSKTSQTHSTPSIFDNTTPTSAVNSKNITSVPFVGNFTSVETTITLIKETTTESKQWINIKSTKASAETKSWPVTSSKTDDPSEITASSGTIKESPAEPTETSTALPSSQKPNIITTEASKVTTTSKTSETYSTPHDKPLTSTVEVSTQTKFVPISPNEKYTTSSITTLEESTETKALPASSSKTNLPSESTASPRITKLSTTESFTESTKTSTGLPNSQKSSFVTTEVTKVTSEEISTITSGSSNQNDAPTPSGKYSTSSIKITEESTGTTGITKSATKPTETSTELPSSQKTVFVTTEASNVTAEEISTLTSGSPNPNESPKTSETYSTPSVSDKTKPSKTTIMSVDEKSTEPWTSTVEVSTEMKSVPVTRFTSVVPTTFSTASPENTKVSTKEGPTVTSGPSNANGTPTVEYSTSRSPDKTTSTKAVTFKNVTSVTLVGNLTTVETTQTPVEDTTTESLPWISKKATEQSAQTKSSPISTIPSGINTKESSTETTNLPTKLSSSQTPYNVTTEATEVTSEGFSTITSGSSNPNESPKTSETDFAPSISDKTTPTETVQAKNITSVTLVGNFTTVETTKTPAEDTTTESLPWISKKTTEQSADKKSLSISTTPSGIITKESSTETTNLPTKLSSSQTPYNVTTEATEVTSEGVSTITSESSNPNESPKTSETLFTPSISDKTTPTETVHAKNITSVTLVGNFTTVETTKTPAEDTTTESLPWISKKTTEQSADTKSLPISTTPSGINTKENSTETTNLPTKLSSSQTPYNVTTEATEVTSEGVSTITSGSSNPNESPKTSETHFAPSISDKTTSTETVNAKNITYVTLVGNFTTVETTKTPPEDTTTESLPWISKKTTEQSADKKSLSISTTPSGIITKESSTETTNLPTKLSSSQTPYNVTTEATEVTSEGVSTITSGSFNPNESPKTSETHFTPSISDKTTPTETVHAKNITYITLVGNFTTVETTKTPAEDTTTESLPWISKKTTEQSADKKSLSISTTPSGIITKESSTETTNLPTKLSSSQTPYNVTTEATEVTSEGVSTITSGSPSEAHFTPSISDKKTPTETVNAKNITSVTLVGNLTTTETTKKPEEDTTTESIPWSSKKTTEDIATTKTLPVSSLKTNTPSDTTPISSGTTNVSTKEISTEGTESPSELSSSLKPYNVTTEAPENTPGLFTKSSSCTSKSEPSSKTTLTTLVTSAFTNHRSTKTPDYKISTESTTRKDFTETKYTPFSSTSSNITNVPSKEISSKVTQSPVTQEIDLSSTLSSTHSEGTLPSSTQVSSRETISPISENLTKSTMEYLTSSIKPDLSTNTGPRNIKTLEPNSEETLSTAKDFSNQPPTPDSLIKITTSTTVNPTLNTEKTQWPLTSSPNNSVTNVTSSSFTTATESSSKVTGFIPERSSTSQETVTSTKISTLISSSDLPTSSELYPNSLITSSEQNVNISTTKFISSTESSTASSKAVCEEGHLYPDPLSCKSYHYCIDGILIQTTCPEYMEFSKLYHLCLPIPIAACSVSTSPSTTTTSQPTTVSVEPSCVEGERYPDPWGCQHYYLCKNASLVHETCPSSTLFSYRALSCMPATSVQCLQLSTTEKICIEPGNKTTNKTTPTNPVTDKIQPTETTTETSTNQQNVTDQETIPKTDLTTLKHPETTTPSDDYPEVVTPKKEAKKKTFKPKAFTIGPHDSILDSYMCTDRFAYPNPNNCSKFYLCEEDKLTVKDCPDGEEFSEDEEICLPADVAGCSNIEQNISIELELYDLSSESRDAEDSSRKGHSETKILIPDLADCRYYISCVNNKCLKTKCVDSEEFSPSELKCLPPKQAGCKKPPVFDNIFGDTCPRYQHSLTYHVYPHFCSYYYVCQYGKLYFYACPYGLEYSTSLLTCTSPSKANCTERNRRRSNDNHGFNIKLSSAKIEYPKNHNIKYHRNGYDNSEKKGFNKRYKTSVEKHATDKNNRTMGNFFSRWLRNRRDFIEKFLL